MGIKRIKGARGDSPSSPEAHKSQPIGLVQTKEDFISNIMSQQTGEIQSLSRLQRAIGFTGSYQLPIEEKGLPRMNAPEDPVATFTMGTVHDPDGRSKDSQKSIRPNDQTPMEVTREPLDFGR